MEPSNGQAAGKMSPSIEDALARAIAALAATGSTRGAAASLAREQDAAAEPVDAQANELAPIGRADESADPESDGERATDPLHVEAESVEPSDLELPTPALGMEAHSLEAVPEAATQAQGGTRPAAALDAADAEVGTLLPEHTILAAPDVALPAELPQTALPVSPSDPAQLSSSAAADPGADDHEDAGAVAMAPHELEVEEGETSDDPEGLGALALGRPLRNTPPPKPMRASDPGAPPRTPLSLALDNTHESARGSEDETETPTPAVDEDVPPSAEAPSEPWPVFRAAAAESAAKREDSAVDWPEGEPPAVGTVPSPVTTEAPPSAPKGFAPATSIPSPALTWNGADSAPQRRAERRPAVPAVIWGVSLIAAFLVGTALKRSPSAESVPASGSRAQAQRPADSSADSPRPAAQAAGAAPLTTRPLDELARLAPGARTKLEAIALGRHWSAQKLAELEQLGEQVRREPNKLQDPNLRSKIFELIADRATSRPALELLVDLNQPLALDILYKVWTGSKDRTETTQLAEALLLAKDVRPRVSPALDVALALREKPNTCLAIRQLVERATRDADRRSAMLLVATGARQTCSEQPKGDCNRCLDDARVLRKAVQEAAARTEPVP